MWWNWEAMRAPPVAEKASRARGSGRQMRKALCRRRRCRAPQQEDALDFSFWISVPPFINNGICGCGGIGRLIGFRFQRASVQVRVLSSAPKQYNPNQVFPVGDGFGFIVFFEKFEETHFRNGVIKRPESKPRGPRKKKQI